MRCFTTHTSLLRSLMTNTIFWKSCIKLRSNGWRLQIFFKSFVNFYFYVNRFQRWKMVHTKGVKVTFWKGSVLVSIYLKFKDVLWNLQQMVISSKFEIWNFINFFSWKFSLSLFINILSQFNRIFPIKKLWYFEKVNPCKLLLNYH